MKKMIKKSRSRSAYNTYTLLTAVFSRDHSSIRIVMTVHTTACKTHEHTHSIHLRATEDTQYCSEVKKPTVADGTAGIGWRRGRVSTRGVAPVPLTVNTAFLVRASD